VVHNRTATFIGFQSSNIAGEFDIHTHTHTDTHTHTHTHTHALTNLHMQKRKHLQKYDKSFSPQTNLLQDTHTYTHTLTRKNRKKGMRRSMTSQPSRRRSNMGNGSSRYGCGTAYPARVQSIMIESRMFHILCTEFEQGTSQCTVI